MEMQIKTSLSFYLNSVIKAKIKNNDSNHNKIKLTANTGGDKRKKEPPFTVAVIANWYSHNGNQC